MDQLTECSEREKDTCRSLPNSVGETNGMPMLGTTSSYNADREELHATFPLAQKYWPKPLAHRDAQHWHDKRSGSNRLRNELKKQPSDVADLDPVSVQAAVQQWLDSPGKESIEERIALLELSHYFEYYLWPNFHYCGNLKIHEEVESLLTGSDSVSVEDESSNQDFSPIVDVDFVMSMVMVLNRKVKDGVPVWPCFRQPGKETMILIDSEIASVPKKPKQMLAESSDGSGDISEVWQPVSSEFYRTKFEHFFYTAAGLCIPIFRLLDVPLDPSSANMASIVTVENRVEILRFFIFAFQSFEEPMVRNCCLKICGPLMWNFLSQEFREGFLFNRAKPTYNMWKQANRKLNKSVGNARTPGILVKTKNSPPCLALCKPMIQANFMWIMLMDFLRLIDNSETDIAGTTSVNHGSTDEADGMLEETILPRTLVYCERFVEWLIDLLSQLWSRRMLHPILIYSQTVPRVKMSALSRHEEGALFNQMTFLLDFYEKFEINDSTGESVEAAECMTRHSDRVWAFQKACFELQSAPESVCLLKKHPNAVTLLERLTKQNIGTIDRPEEIRHLLMNLGTPIVEQLCRKLCCVGIDDIARCTEASQTTSISDDQLIVEMLAHQLEKREDQVSQINNTALYPTENLLWDTNLVPTEFYRGNNSLALPKLNLQFLTIHDYLLRNFTLMRLESTHEVREDIEFSVRRMCARKAGDGKTIFDGNWPMALPMESLSVIMVGNPHIGQSIPAQVKAEFTISLAGLRDELRDEWDNLREFDVLLLVAIVAPEEHPTQQKGIENPSNIFDYQSVAQFPETFGVMCVRGAEIYEIVDEAGNVLTEKNPGNWKTPVGTNRTIRVYLDPFQYLEDITLAREQGTDDLYGSFNLVIRREPRANNFKAVLSTIRSMMNNSTNNVVPEWLHDLFLGYGDPAAANYRNLPTALKQIDFVDTFLDDDHLKASFPGCEIALSEKEQSYSNAQQQETFYRICFDNDSEQDRSVRQLIKATAYLQTPLGVHRNCFIRTNSVRFSPAQVEAIHSGVNPGLTMIVGPPGTGKTDTAVQIANLLYRNFPEERILLIAHSNQALNELFRKISNLNISERYLLRLGLGEKDLLSGKDFSKYGRVSYMLERRLQLLNEASTLGHSIGLLEDVGLSCETARQFYEYHVLPRIQRFYGHLEALKEVVYAGVSDKFSDLPFSSPEEAKKGSRPHIANISAAMHQVLQVLQENYGPAYSSALANTNTNTSPQQKVNDKQNSAEDSNQEEVEEEEPEMSAPISVNQQEDRGSLTTKLLNKDETIISIIFPFKQFFTKDTDPLFPTGAMNKTTAEKQESLLSDRQTADAVEELVESVLFKSHMETALACCRYLVDLFVQLQECHAFELLRTTKHRGHYLLTKHAKIIAMTCTHAALTRDDLVDANFKYDSLIMEEAAQILEVETFIPMLLQNSDNDVSRLRRVVLIGDHNQLPPVVKNRAFQQYGKLDQSLFSRLIRLQAPFVELDKQGRARPSICELYRWRYEHLEDLDHIVPGRASCTGSAYERANAGLCFDYQFINVQDYQGRGEVSPIPFVYENLGEAEYAVTFFMYLRLLGYPAERISILTTYNGQLRLLKNVIKKRCSRAIGEPAAVATVDKYQGQQNDYIILSLVRTRSVGHIRDVRRLVVAMSRAKLGLYILGRLPLFQNVLELRPVFKLLERRPTKLALTRFPERWPSNRRHDAVVPNDETYYVEDVIHMYHIMQSYANQIVASMKEKEVEAA